MLPQLVTVGYRRSGGPAVASISTSRRVASLIFAWS